MSLKAFTGYATDSFTMPDVCVRLRTMLDSDKTGIEEIAQLISIDPNLSAKVLRLANSALFRFPSQIETVGKAITVIGGEALYNIVMAETASIAFKHFDNTIVNVTRHWHYSVYCGITAQNIARKRRIRGSERFFVMGILHGLAHLVVAKHAPQKYQLLVSPKAQGLPWETQRSVLGFTLAECSGAILEKWNLPLPLYFPIKHMHDESKVKQDTDVCIMTLACQVTESQLDKQRYQSVCLWDKTQKILDLSEEDIFETLEHTETDTARIASALLA
jgi:HD-like signal output (HDOD) protein